MKIELDSHLELFLKQQNTLMEQKEEFFRELQGNGLT